MQKKLWISLEKEKKYEIINIMGKSNGIIKQIFREEFDKKTGSSIFICIECEENTQLKKMTFKPHL